MERPPMYHDGSRALQDRFDSRRLADRLEQLTVHDAFSEHDKAFVESADLFFLATADADGWPDVSHKGGLPGFVQVLDEKTLAFPSYDGNGQFRSLGNLLVNPRVGLLFIDFERPKRLRVQGVAHIRDEPDLVARWEGAELIVTVTAERIFPNCPRYIHPRTLIEHSPFAPRADYVPPIPEWKHMDAFRDFLPGAPGGSSA
ncbi:MAG TPA: pyridoxamine 5'-phosphate oxidase family protein [Acidimicrobiales bacterium]|nr:pyridoxamine 5'-phosphate oxidase family protein [Acidimicrobiales bacterium]